ncbi:MAG TPA: hypothetical protein VF147_11680 [Vicinamibacterales bacterium]
MRLPAAAGVAVLLACGVRLSSAQPPPPAAVRDLLRAIAPFSAAELASIERGEAVARVIDTERREVAIAGATRIRAPRERLLARYRDISILKQSDAVLQIGPIGRSPTAADFSPLVFEPYDLDTIRECEPGDCGVRLSTAQLQRFRTDVNWAAPDWQQQAGALWRRLLAEYAAGYLATGALADYRNKSEPLNVADEFRVVFDRSRPVAAAAPAFFAYFEQFPKVQLPGVETILYWSKDDLGLRPITSITHLALYTPPSDSKEPVVIGTRQIYATHYFDAALGLTLAFADEDGGFYMVCLNRARTRSLASFTRGIVRGVVVRRSREATEQMLRATKRSLEQPPPSRGPAPNF